MNTLAKGDLAYCDAFLSGLIPCKVLDIEPASVSGYAITVVLTATRGAWKRGEVLVRHSTDRSVIPRGAVYRTSGQYRIAPYSIAA